MRAKPQLIRNNKLYIDCHAVSFVFGPRQMIQ